MVMNPAARAAQALLTCRIAITVAESAAAGRARAPCRRNAVETGSSAVPRVSALRVRVGHASPTPESRPRIGGRGRYGCALRTASSVEPHADRHR